MPLRSSCRREAVEALESRRLLAATPVLVGNINQQASDVGPDQAVDVAGTTFFTGHPNAGDGAELMKTDRTYRGTVLVRDINPTTGSEPDLLTNVNGTLFFVADDGVSGRELWKSDGTTAGTTRVADLAAGTAAASPSLLTNVGGTLYFIATDGSSGSSAVLYKTDGTAAGTVKVTTAAGGAVTGLVELISYHNTLVGVDYNGNFYTATGTTATRQTFVPSYARWMTVFNDAIYFSISTSSFSTTDRGDLYKTDLTAGGTFKVKAIDAVNGTASSFIGSASFRVSGDRLYFLTYDALSGKNDFWTSDGTTAGTTTLRSNTNLDPSEGGRQFTPFGTRSLIFTNSQTTTGTEPWVSDGTFAGTHLLKDLNPGTAGSSYGGAFTLTDGRAGLLASKGYGTTATLYTTDGTAANTTAYIDITQVSGAAYLIGSANGAALFTTVRTFGDGLLWRTDGTAAGTGRLAVFGLGDGSSMIPNQTSFFATGDTLFFGADNGYSGVEPFRSTNGATPVSLGDINVGGGDSGPGEFVQTADGQVYFTAQASASGERALYRTGVNGTVAVPAVNLPGGSIRDLVAVGNRVYFSRYNVALGRRELWSYASGSGSAATQVTLDGKLLSPDDLFGYNGSLYFGAQPYTTGTSDTPVQRLYRIDAISTTPQLVADIPSGSSSAYAPTPFGGAGDSFYFTATTAAAGEELYKVPAVGTGATLVADITPGSASTSFVSASFFPDNVVANGTTLYFTAYDATGTSRLYRTDGTPTGTVPIGTDLTAGGAIGVVGGQTYFVGRQNGAAGVFRVDGTNAVRVSPVATGDAAFEPTALHVAGDRLFAVGFGGARARFELWSTDAAATTLSRVSIIGPYTPTGYASPLYQYFGYGRGALSHTGDALFLPTFDPATGVELYRLPLAATGSISGVVYNDANADGTLNGTDASVAGDTLYLDTNSNGALDAGETTTVATATGYRFADLGPGSYTVRRLPTTDGRRQTAPYASPTGALAINLTLAAGQNASGQDFGTTALPPVAAVANVSANEGGGAILNGAASYESLGSIVKYEWDFDYDGVTFDANATTTGASAVFNAATLDGNAVRTVGLRVTDANGLRGTATATVTINNVAPTAAFAADGPTIAGGTAVVRLSNPVDVAADLPGLRYSFDFDNNGSFTDAGDVSLSTSAAASHVFAAAGTYTVRGRVTDKDGGQTDYTTTVLVSAVDPQAVTLEGETATFAGGTAASAGNGGYTGNGYADFAGINSSAQWSLTRVAAGGVTLGFRYANGGTVDRPLTIYVNGVSIGTLAMPATGAWTTWQTATIAANLAAGTNTIKAVASASVGGANVDSLTVVRAVPAWLSPAAGAVYTLAGNTLTVTAGVVTLLADAATTHSGLNVVVADAARLVTVSSQHLGSLTLNGTAAAAMSGPRGQVLRVTGLTLAATATLDLNEADFILDYAATAASPAATIRGLIATARSNGSWTGPGLTSNAAKTDSGNRTTLGYLTAAEYKSIYGAAATFARETIDDSALLVRTTLYGDADFDGGVSINDFNRLSANFGNATSRTWIAGDFDYDGGVSINDFNLLSTNFAKTLAVAAQPS